MKWDAEKYDSANAPQVEAGRELIRMAAVRPADRILDIGCGTGKLALELARLAPEGKVIGIDPSEEMLQKAVSVSAGAANLKFMRGSAQEMDFRESFDLAFSNSALHWVKKPEEQRTTLAKTFRALAPGGRIAFQMLAMDFCTEFFEYAGRAVKAAGLDRFFDNFVPPWHLASVQQYAGLLREAGFSEINAFFRQYRLTFGSIKDVLDYWCQAVLRPYLSVLPELERGYFKYAFAMQFEANRSSSGNGIEFDFRRLFALAVKSGEGGHI
ncbi:MAG: methyltransferase domain-containing protein [Nitrospiraceae bacterium]|nr:methyltransferase domain-containing protein [Nitrospiraceae bacterium]